MPPRTRAEAPSVVTAVRVSPLEQMLIRMAAQVNHQRPSQFIRDAIVIAAAECMEGVRPPVPRQKKD